MASIYDLGLEKNGANYVALTPATFLSRAASVHPHRIAILYGARRQTWRETDLRCRRLASALRRRGIGRGDTVAALMPNVPALIEAHFGVPMAGAVLNAINTRLDAASVAFMLEHGEAKALLVDRELAPLARAALDRLGRDLLLVDVDDPELGLPLAAGLSYDALLAEGDPAFEYGGPADEWDAICLNYTSGTTGDPKGVVYHHRGAYLNAISNVLEWDLPKHPVYLWTLPLFHCNGWCFAWTVAARAGTNVCLRKMDPKVVFDLIREHRVTHYCGAPIVHSSLVAGAAEHGHGIRHRVSAMVAGAAPPAAMIEAMEGIGFDLTHVYGLTEVYGPASVSERHDHWSALPIAERARLHAQQGVRYHLQEAIAVLDPTTLTPVAADGETLGEVMFRGNITMKGYLKNPTATAAAFAGGWFHTGDLGVMSPDGYVKVKDRSKDIIISGGENIASLEIEEVLYRHPAVLGAAVVAQRDARWGETPCAFVELHPGAEVAAEALIAFCRERLSAFKVPRAVVFGPLPRTSTGKIQKFELRARAGSSRAISD